MLAGISLAVSDSDSDGDGDSEGHYYIPSTSPYNPVTNQFSSSSSQSAPTRSQVPFGNYNYGYEDPNSVDGPIAYITPDGRVVTTNQYFPGGFGFRSPLAPSANAVVDPYVPIQYPYGTAVPQTSLVKNSLYSPGIAYPQQQRYVPSSSYPTGLYPSSNIRYLAGTTSTVPKVITARTQPKAVGRRTVYPTNNRYPSYSYSF